MSQTSTAEPSRPDFIGLPERIVWRNGGTRCDMLTGPCACGAWHNREESRFWSIVLQMDHTERKYVQPD